MEDSRAQDRQEPFSRAGDEERVSPMTDDQRKARLSIFRLRIFHSSVWRGIPSFTAAPRGPATLPRVSLSAASISVFSPSARVVTAAPLDGVRGLRASHDSSITNVSPSLN